ncbi:MAG: type II toxin-antitoxin system PemK/MazF family toxin [Chloroflexi bacterium]|nr:type II toxin-antitoxin system PemK/MazF family toxin [Chloroflexota bacterium]MCZ7577865.1 type II toxin-antitoxin system PemK/MazF family toxin [Dehalococcoidia bacterium]NJD64685.1 type II toxin-antitoxin system PemK/MazF family toxin [Chloroflexota bacterium]PWB69288.1 MAG: type II toxin-antitoxin system PemK/MazF family toxin [Holophagae bacterium]
MNRGDVYLARLDPVEGSEQAGTRPVVIVSRDSLNNTRTHVIAVPLTRTRGSRLLPSQVVIPEGDGGLPSESVARTEHVRVLSKKRLLRRWGVLSAASLRSVEAALRITLQL